MNGWKLLLITACALFACHSRTPKPAIENVTPDRVRRSVFDEADRLLLRSVEPDYSTYPSLIFRFQRQAIPLIDGACRDGDRRGCIAMVAVRELTAEGERRLYERCTAGDVLSCRALVNQPGALNPRRIESAPGGVLDIEGFKEACYIGDELTCDYARIRDECARGLAMSCRSLAAELGPASDAERERAWKRALELARHGCELGILTECTDIMADERSSMKDQITGLARACRLQPSLCGGLGNLYLEIGERR